MSGKKCKTSNKILSFSVEFLWGPQLRETQRSASACIFRAAPGKENVENGLGRKELSHESGTNRQQVIFEAEPAEPTSNPKKSKPKNPKLAPKTIRMAISKLKCCLKTGSKFKPHFGSC